MNNLIPLIQRARSKGLVVDDSHDGIEIRTSIGSSITLFFTQEGAFEFADRSIDGHIYEPEHMDELTEYLEERIGA